VDRAYIQSNARDNHANKKTRDDIKKSLAASNKPVLNLLTAIDGEDEKALERLHKRKTRGNRADKNTKIN
jgi:hypothetical protein